MKRTAKDRRAALLKRYPEWRPMCLHQLLDEAAGAFPASEYVVTDQASWSYAEIEARSKVIAGGLRKIGVSPGDHVAVIMANFVEFVAPQICHLPTGRGLCSDQFPKPPG